MATIAIDFDGTIVVHRFPKIGTEIPGALKVIQTLQDNGHKLFLWTMRGYCTEYKRCLEEAVDWLNNRGVYFDRYNRTPDRFGTASPKQHANLYIDDATLGCPLQVIEDRLCVDWMRVIKYLHAFKYITLEQFNNLSEYVEQCYHKSGITYQPYM